MIPLHISPTWQLTYKAVSSYVEAVYTDCLKFRYRYPGVLWNHAAWWEQDRSPEDDRDAVDGHKMGGVATRHQLTPCSSGKPGVHKQALHLPHAASDLSPIATQRYKTVRDCVASASFFLFGMCFFFYLTWCLANAVHIGHKIFVKCSIKNKNSIKYSVCLFCRFRYMYLNWATSQLKCS